MIKTFSDKHTPGPYKTGKSKRLQSDIRKRAICKLEYSYLAATLDDLRIPPSNRHLLRSKRKDQYAISINDQWRICFRSIDGDAYDVEITDYH